MDANVIKMNSTQIQAMITTLRNETANIASEVDTHMQILATLTSNPHMVGSIQHIEESLESAKLTHSNLQTYMEELIEVIVTAEKLGGELEEKYIGKFKELAGDDFTTDATLDNIEYAA